MKKLMILLIPVLLLAGCRKAPVQALSASDKALLEQVVDMEEFDRLKPQAQQEILENLGLGDSASRYSFRDAEGKGRYMVVLSDARGLNVFTLFYEDGVLAKVATSFQKTAKDTPIATYFTGDRLEEYHYKSIRFMDYTVSQLAELLSYEGFPHASISPAE